MLGRLTTVFLLVAAITAPGRAVALNGCFQPPVVAPVADPYRPPECRWCPGNRGIDYATRAGTTVHAGGDGIVSFAGPVAGSVWITVEHPGGLKTSYGPMARAAVRVGQAVRAGQPLGTTSGPLHFGVRLDGRYIDPGLVLGRPVHLVPRLVRLEGRIARPPTVRCPVASAEVPTVGGDDGPPRPAGGGGLRFFVR